MSQAIPEGVVIVRAARFLVLALLGAYRRFVSPMLPAACRFLPTCSEYAATAVERHGVLRGLARAFLRLLRCHPLSRGGYDPIT